MSEYRVRTTGEIKTQGQIRKENPNMSLPRIWNDNTCVALNIEPVLRSPKPEPTAPYKIVLRDGAERDDNNNWVQAWTERDMFETYTNMEGVEVTKAEQETAYQEKLDAEAAEQVRARRDGLIAETDWWASSDLTMTTEQTTYRQALRDITAHADFPHLADADWPTKPE